MRAALFVIFVVLAFAVTANADAPQPDEDRCAVGGGCLTMTRAQIIDAMTNAHALGVEKGREAGYQKGQQTCWRPA